MDNKGYGNIPSTLSECITFIVQALPIRSVPTFIEFLNSRINIDPLELTRLDRFQAQTSLKGLFQ